MLGTNSSSPSRNRTSSNCFEDSRASFTLTGQMILVRIDDFLAVCTFRKCPCQESNLICNLRTVECYPVHFKDSCGNQKRRQRDSNSIKLALQASPAPSGLTPIFKHRRQESNLRTSGSEPDAATSNCYSGTISRTKSSAGGIRTHRHLFLKQAAQPLAYRTLQNVALP